MPEPTAPLFPAGPFNSPDAVDETQITALIQELGTAPTQCRDAIEGLADEQLDTRYRNWTVRQIIHHVADSHVHSYIRFKWALTEENPVIKAYEEADWVQLGDSASGDVQPALALLTGIHSKWNQLLRTMSDGDFNRTFVHPQTSETVCLWEALNYYPWHTRHHVGQIQWLRKQYDW